MLHSIFEDLIFGKPEAILSDLAKDLSGAIANEMNAAECGGRPAVAGQFCNFQTYEVPRDFVDPRQAAQRDMLAQQAYVRTCEDPTGSKLLDGSSQSDLCAVVISMIYCAQAMPACREDVWLTNCLDTCVLANHCSSRQGGQKVPLQTCQFQICKFPQKDYEPWQIWKCRTWWQIFLFVVFIIVFIALGVWVCCCCCANQ